MNQQQVTLIATTVAPALLPLAALAIRPAATARAAVAGAAAAVGGTMVMLAANAWDGPVSVISTAGSGAPLGLYADRMSSVLFLLISGVLLIVQGFASRYLLGDTRANRFFVLCGATASATLISASAASFSVLVVAWSAAGVLLCLMLMHRRELAEARCGARRAAATFAIGDGALIASLVLVLVSGPDLDLRDPAAAAASLAGRDVAGLAIAPVVAALIAVAALARSAQFPLHRWLPSTLAAPTPVSAMLHAGLVNGAGLLLIGLASVVALEPSLLWALLAAGLATALLGTMLSLVRSDVKGSLAWSTTAQMGFMVAQCATGGFAAALLHMFGHGIYKANLFLGSGGIVAARVRSETAPGSEVLLPRPARLAVSMVLPALLLYGSIALISPHLLENPGIPVLIGFALASAGRATWSWLSSAGNLGLRWLTAGVALLATACLCYVGIVAAFESYLAAELPAIAPATPAAWILPLAIGAAALCAVGLRLASAGSARAAELELAAWSAARSLSDPHPVARPMTSRSASQPVRRTRPAIIGAAQ